MKRQLIAIILLLFLSILLFHRLSPSEAASKEESEWFPFVLAERMDPDSPANIGKLVLDAPAGKHGFVTVKDGHFYFENGTRARFWGTNLCFSANFPSKKQAEIMAERLAFFGFNAVRLHHMDFYFEPNGIFEDIAPAYKDPQLKETGHLSKKQLDRLDYLIYQLKQRGIYVDMNLLVSRHFTEADGVIDAEKLGMAAKPVSMFDPKLIELQKKYAKDLFTHYNKYTKLKYCDDPAIALVEITNENSITKLINKKSIPDYYKKQLAKKHTQDKSKTNFYRYLEKQYFDQMTDFLKNELNVKVPITGSQYSDGSTQESCDFIDAHAYWDHPRFPNKSWSRNDFRIYNKSMLKDKNLGIIGRILKKQKAASQKPFTITEWDHCYPNQYAYETPAFMASEAVKNNWAGLFQFAFSHGWKFNPKFNNIESYFDIIANPQQLILCSVASLIYHKTDTIKTETKNGVLKINSSKIKGIAGFIKEKSFALQDLTIKAKGNGAVFLYSSEDTPIQESKKLILVTLSEIKNKNSGWNSYGRFNWGTHPTLLKKLAVDITLETSNNLKVYELTNAGKRGKEIPLKRTDSKVLFSTKGTTSPWFEISTR